MVDMILDDLTSFWKRTRYFILCPIVSGLVPALLHAIAFFCEINVEAFSVHYSAHTNPFHLNP